MDSEMFTMTVKYVVPPDIATQLATGEVFTFGSVVHNGTQIVAHLKEVDRSVEEAAKGLTRLVSSLSRTQKTGLGLVLVVGSVGAARFGWGRWKSRRQVPQVELPQDLAELVDALDAYIAAIQDGKVMASDVARAVTALDAVIASQESGDIDVEVSEDRMRAIGALVDDYTRAFVETYGGDLPAADVPPSTVVDLRSRLDEQHRVLTAAA